MALDRDAAALPLNPPAPPRALLSLIRAAPAREVERGEVILREGRAPPGLILLVWGAAAVASTAASGRRAIVEVLGPGDAWGQEALLAGPSPPPFMPELRALVPARFRRIPTEQADPLDPDLLAWLARSLAERDRRIQRRLASTLTLPVPQRLLRLLADLGERYGAPAQGRVRVGLPLTQEALASMVGATRESVNRALRELEWSGDVRRRGRRYELRVGASS